MGTPPPNAIELDFDVVKEGWSVYRVKDGEYEVTVKVKLVLIKLFLEQIDASGNALFAVGANVLFSVTAPQGFKGPKSTETYTTEELASSLVAEDLPFETVKEDWNDYRTPENVTIGIKPVMTRVSRTSKFDANGDPIYYVWHQTVQRGKAPKESQEKLKKLLDSKTPVK